MAGYLTGSADNARSSWHCWSWEWPTESQRRHQISACWSSRGPWLALPAAASFQELLSSSQINAPETREHADSRPGYGPGLRHSAGRGDRAGGPWRSLADRLRGDRGRCPGKHSFPSGRGGQSPEYRAAQPRGRPRHHQCAIHLPRRRSGGSSGVRLRRLFPLALQHQGTSVSLAGAGTAAVGVGMMLGGYVVRRLAEPARRTPDRRRRKHPRARLCDGTGASCCRSHPWGITDRTRAIRGPRNPAALGDRGSPGSPGAQYRRLRHRRLRRSGTGHSARLGATRPLRTVFITAAICAAGSGLIAARHPHPTKEALRDRPTTTTTALHARFRHPEDSSRRGCVELSRSRALRILVHARQPLAEPVNVYHRPREIVRFLSDKWDARTRLPADQGALGVYWQSDRGSFRLRVA